MKPTLFEIPVYDQAEDAFIERQQQTQQPYVDAASERGEKEERAHAIARGHVGERWGGWRFNRIVGWIVVSQDGASIKVDLWWTEHRRISRSGPQVHRIGGTSRRRLFETGLAGGESSDEIRCWIATGLTRVATEPPLDRNFIERESFDRVSPHVDWRSLLGYRTPPNSLTSALSAPPEN